MTEGVRTQVNTGTGFAARRKNRNSKEQKGQKSNEDKNERRTG